MLYASLIKSEIPIGVGYISNTTVGTRALNFPKIRCRNQVAIKLSWNQPKPKDLLSEPDFYPPAGAPTSAPIALNK